MALEVRDSALHEPAGQTPAGLESHPLYIPRLWATLHPRGKVQDLIFESDGAAAVAAFGIVDQSRHQVIFSEKSLTIPVAPHVRDNDPALASQFFQDLIEVGRRRTWKHIELHWSYGECDALEACRAVATEIEPEIEFFIDLGAMAPEYAGRYAPGGARFARAQRVGLSTEIGGSWEDLLALRSLQLSSSTRAAEKQNVYSLPEEEYYRLVYKAALEPGHSRIIFAVKDGRRISGLMFLVRAGRAIVQRGGSSDEARAVDGSRYVHGMLLHHLKESGCRDVYFGGVPATASEPGHPEHGLYEFKKSYPATQRSAFRARIELR
jgi:hypothetical protein